MLPAQRAQAYRGIHFTQEFDYLSLVKTFFHAYFLAGGRVHQPPGRPLHSLENPHLQRIDIAALPGPPCRNPACVHHRTAAPFQI